MRISELSSRSGVSTASIKFYTREGLLPAGDRTGYNQTHYSAAHLDRLRLIRSLIDVGGLTVAAVSKVLAAIDSPDMPMGNVLGVAHHALPQAVTPPTAESVERVDKLAAERGWRSFSRNPGIRAAAAVLDGYTAVGREDLAAVLPAYAEAAEIIARADLDAVHDAVSRAEDDRQAAAQTVVVGTVLGDQLLAGLRRVAQENEAVRRYGPPPRGE